VNYFFRRRCAFSISPHATHPTNVTILVLFTLIILDRKHELWSCFLCNSFHSPVTSSSIGQNFHLSTLSTNILNRDIQHLFIESQFNLNSLPDSPTSLLWHSTHFLCLTARMHEIRRNSVWRCQWKIKHRLCRARVNGRLALLLQ
jgi:hypothetical protein